VIATNFNDSTFFKEMSNVVKYAEGFLEGVQAGKPQLLNKMGRTIKEVVKEFIDSQARVDPARLHHVYEWYQAGQASARLFDIDYVVTGAGLSFSSTFSQSKSLARGSTVPFYDKAYIMEKGIPVTIKPRSAKALAFTDNGEQVFVKGEIEIENPGGSEVAGSFEEVMNIFFDRYLTQSYLVASGFTYHLENPTDFKKNLSRAKSGGKSAGKQIGYNWIVKAGDKL
jgi:hypothetical protein